MVWLALVITAVDHQAPLKGGAFWLPEQLSAYREGLCHMQLLHGCRIMWENLYERRVIQWKPTEKHGGYFGSFF
jgi:hypothetical protein